MKIAEAASQRTGDRAEVAVEGDNLEQVYSLQARQAALDHAVKLGLNRPGFNGSPWVEWVDDSGNVLVGEAFKNSPVKKCRAHFPIQAGF